MKPTPREPLDPLSVLAQLSLKLYHRFRPLKDTPTARINAVISATNLANFNGETPTLISSKPTESGETLTYKLPPGIIKKDFVDRRDHFETYGSFLSDYHNNGTPIITINTYTESLPTLYPYTYTYTKSDGIAPLPLGIKSNGQPLTVCLTTLPHLLLGGMTGYGKTSLLLALTVALRTAGCRVIAIDHKRMDFPTLTEHLTVSLRESDTLTILNNVILEMERRLDLFSGNVQKFQNYHGDELLPYIVVLIDELTTIDDKTIQKAINDIAARGRAPGISLILATQKPSAKVWDGFTDTRDLCTGRLSFYVSDYFMSAAILGKGNTRACSLPMIPGRAILTLGDKEHLIQTPYLTAESALGHLQKLGKVEHLNHAETTESNTIWNPTKTEHFNPHIEIGSNDDPTINNPILSGVKRNKKSASGTKGVSKPKTTKANASRNRSELSVLPDQNPES